jgi:hypothetical protein
MDRGAEAAGAGAGALCIPRERLSGRGAPTL